MNRDIIRKLGVSAATAIFTAIITAAALILYLLSCLIFPPVAPIGVMYSIVIPALLVPITMFRSFTTMERLEKSEAALKRSENRCRLLIERAGDAILLLKDGVFVDCNLKALEMYECTKTDLMGKSPADISPALQPDGLATLEKVKELITATSHNKEAKFEWRHKQSNGRLFDVEVSLSKIEMPDGDHLQAIVRDISARKALEETLRQSETKYRKLFENISDAVIISNAETEQYEDANIAALGLFGYTRDEFKSLYVKDITAEQAVTKNLHRHLVAGDPASKRVPLRYFRKKDGSVFPGEIIHGLYGENGSKKIICSLRDISERIQSEKDKRELQQHLQQAQKMEAIGTLAGGIAHDFNNILSIIFGYTELTADTAKDQPEIRQGLDQIIVAANRARSLVQQILTFSRQDGQELVPMKVGFIVKEVFKLLRATLPTTIEMNYSTGPDVGIVNGNATQLHQVLMNLCTNAAHAMNHQNGRLDLRLVNEHIREPAHINGVPIKPGDYIKMTVADTGTGIPPENLKHIFEPYYTTKEKGVGTGLGLSVVEGIVKTHGGLITVESTIGKGTSFHIYLPVVQQVALPVLKKPEVIKTGTERVLIVDDEPTLTMIAAEMLARLGYKPESRTSGIEALKLFSSCPGNFDLVITDMTMPHMTGDQLAKEILAIRPDFPIIVCTGFSERIDKEKAASMGIKALVMKPILVTEISNTIRSVLDQSKAECTA